MSASQVVSCTADHDVQCSYQAWIQGTQRCKVQLCGILLQTFKQTCIDSNPASLGNWCVVIMTVTRRQSYAIEFAVSASGGAIDSCKCGLLAHVQTRSAHTVSKAHPPHAYIGQALHCSIRVWFWLCYEQLYLAAGPAAPLLWPLSLPRSSVQ